MLSGLSGLSGCSGLVCTGNPWDALLVGEWLFDESSGPAVDSAGSADMTAINSPGTAAGKVGTARTFNGSNQGFTLPDADFDLDADLSWDLIWWVYPATTTTQYMMFSGSTNPNIWATLNGVAGKLRAEYYSNGFVGPRADVTTTDTVTASAWNMLRIRYAKSVTTHGTLYLSINNGSEVSAALSGAIVHATQTNYLFHRASGHWPFSGRADAMRLFRGSGLEAYASSIGDFYYNGGAGR